MRIDRLLASYLRTRRAMTMSSDRLARHRARQWRALQPALRRTPALESYAGQELDDFPVSEPGEIRADYGRWTSLGLSDEAIHRMADAAEQGAAIAGLAVGYSTGTAGRRGIFMADAAERADYIGQSLARILPPSALFRRQRLALHLRANSALYSDVSTRHFAYRHFALGPDPDATQVELDAFRPTILIAPPHRLLAFARRHDARSGRLLAGLRHLFYGSEPMSEVERAFVRDRFGLDPRPIYQATEGFLGAACRFGALHLNDHSFEIELEPVPGTDGFRPVITDLRRRSQPVVRVRGDDYLELAGATCPCGFAGRIIAPIAGRVQDIWRYGTRAITPREVERSIERSLGAGHCWQATGGSAAVTLSLEEACPRHLAAQVADGLRRDLALGVPVLTDWTLVPGREPKRRKVVWQDA